MVAPAARAILFDFGGVIWNMRWDVACRLEGTHRLPAEALRTTLYQSAAWRELERGRGDREAWLAGAHADLEKLAGHALPPLHAEWRAAQGPVAANVELIRALRPSYRLAVLSNSDTMLRSRLSDGLGIAALFDEIVCSAEVGCAKPEPEIYVLTCARLGLPPAACVFVDDSEPNVRAAQAVGMQGVLHHIERGDDLRAQLAAVSVRPGAS